MQTHEVIQAIQPIHFKKDVYARRRGKPKMLLLACSQCQCYLMAYQKDGPGPLIRCYLDRIVHPLSLQQRQYESFNEHTAPSLQCHQCKVVIGSPMIYEKECRPAYHLRQGFFLIVCKDASNKKNHSKRTPE